ncbi:hypothetical protein ACGFMM_10685 [Streptomyces sp. NPDC048604]|uniref:hypothetical protein n=1 Tax=Streptomyces sp. NPDC048604 TaxID=3365578 RepID=UPI003710D5B0
MTDGNATSGNHNYGQQVNVYGGRGNHGSIVNHHAPAAPAGLEDALRAVLEQAARVRGQLAPSDARSVDETLPVLDPDAPAPPEDRRRALLTVAGVAATVGAVAQPLLDSVRAALELLGG